MKKSLTTLLLCTAGIATNANAFFKIPGWDSNWLVGAKAGYVTAYGPLTLWVNNSEGQNIYNRTFQDDAFMAGLLAGYQARCGRWLMGLEFNADWRNLDQTHDFAGTSSNMGEPVIFDPVEDVFDATGSGFLGTVRYERDWAFGLSARVGYSILNCLMPYVRLGVELSDDELSVSFMPVAGPFSGVTTAFSESDWTYRLFGGVGVEMPFPYLMAGLSMRGEYTYYHRGQGVTAHAIRSSATVPPDPTFFTASMKERNQAVTLALVWNFG